MKAESSQATNLLLLKHLNRVDLEDGVDKVAGILNHLRACFGVSSLSPNVVTARPTAKKGRRSTPSLRRARLEEASYSLAAKGDVENERLRAEELTHVARIARPVRDGGTPLGRMRVAVGRVGGSISCRPPPDADAGFLEQRGENGSSRIVDTFAEEIGGRLKHRAPEVSIDSRVTGSGRDEATGGHGGGENATGGGVKSHLVERPADQKGN